MCLINIGYKHKQNIFFFFSFFFSIACVGGHHQYYIKEKYHVNHEPSAGRSRTMQLFAVL